jgi:hypothetical protein
MKDADLIEEDDRDATAFAFTHFRAKPTQQRLYVFPGNVCAGRVGEDRFQRLLMDALHA